jgi:uncharacterized protein (DUF983 family)
MAITVAIFCFVATIYDISVEWVTWLPLWASLVIQEACAEPA